ncbi:ATP-binding protein [Nocardia sp. NPDC050378]|uniref:ATP-binding protein n=1 Tax=Nocardia sp. NPDC050378 TaxID=3155400 RepID=UPI0034111293
MASSERTVADSTHATSTHLRIDADLGQLVMVRAVAETAAHLAGFTPDEIADIRVAVDEAATSLILAAVPDTRLHCDVTADGFRLRIAVQALCVEPDPVDETAFGWNVLHSITDHLATGSDRDRGELDGFPVTITFTRVRRVPAVR